MPIVTIKLIEGRSIEKKRALVEKMTQVICETVNQTPENVRIIIEDMSKHDYAIAGKLMCDT